MHLPPELVHPSPGRFREPVIDAGEEGEDRARRDDVMEVRDHVIGVVQVEIGGVERERDAGEPADAEHRQERRREEHRGVKRIEPPQSEMKNALRMMTDGIEMIIVVVWKNALTTVPMPVSYMWCAQTMKERNPRTRAAKTSDL